MTETAELVSVARSRLLKGDVEFVERRRVPGGWLYVTTYAYAPPDVPGASGPAVAVTSIFVSDPYTGI